MVEVKHASREDLPRLAGIESLCFSRPWSEEAFFAFSDHGGVILTATEDGAVTGHVTAAFVLDEGEILNLAVLPDKRRHGTGTALIAALEREAASRGAKRLFLEVRASNAGAIALYEKAGFYPVGRRKDFYEAPREDALLYRKDTEDEHTGV